MKIPHQNDKFQVFFPSILLSMLWMYAAASKIVDHHRFIQQMEIAPFFPVQNMAGLLGWAIPAIELVLVALLCVPSFRKIGLALSIALLFIFELYITGMLLSGSKLPCSCGGLISALRWNQHLIFNVVFILIASIPFWFIKRTSHTSTTEYSARSI